MQLTDFKDIHKGGKCLVLGLGSSLNDIESIPGGVWTIGVNNIQQKFDTDYLVTLDSIQKFDEERKQAIINNKGILFTQLGEWKKVRDNVVEFKLGNYGGMNLGRNLEEGKLNYSFTSPFVACVLAIYMGFEEIGLLGVDFTDNHFNKKDGKHNLVGRLSQIDKHFEEINRFHKIYNLSSVSLLRSLDSMELSSFIS